MSGLTVTTRPKQIAGSHGRISFLPKGSLISTRKLPL